MVSVVEFKGLKLYIEDQLIKYKQKNILILCPKKDRSYYNNLVAYNNILFVCLDPLDAYGVIFSLRSWPFKNKIFDIIILHNHIAFIDDLAESLQEVYAKLADGGLFIMIEWHANGAVKIKDKACDNVIGIGKCLSKQGFTKEAHRFFCKNGEISSFFLKPVFLFTNNRFVLIYSKQVMPLTPHWHKELQKQLKPSPVYASVQQIKNKQ